MHFHSPHVTWTYELYTRGTKNWKVEGESPQ